MSRHDRNMESVLRRDRQILAMVVNEKHLACAAIEELRTQISQTSNRFLILDNFLSSAHQSQLQILIAEHGQFKRNLKVTPDATVVQHLDKQDRYGRVNSQIFESAAPDDQFISQNVFTTPKPEHENRKPANTDLLVRRIIGHPAMHRWLERICDQTISRSVINLKSHGAGHFLKKHSDSRGNRKLCAVLYLHDHWEPKYRGRFMLHMHNGTVRYIDPMPNRLILFDTTVKNMHEIEALGTIPDGWLRMNYSFWFI